MGKKYIKIKLKAYDHKLLDESAKKIIEAVKEVDAKVSGPIPLPVERSVYSVIRSPHKYAYSMEQFEKRVHKRVIYIYEASSETVTKLMKVSIPAGVAVDIKA
ncbi:MAG: 30S ribosomal protein S10 [Thermotogae bacterium]|nr:30S ribosomal protein S10 [Thermotogota bacterium]MCP5465728.1 30S ribosomal protein S10 [Thermotogota bacterium]